MQYYRCGYLGGGFAIVQADNENHALAMQPLGSTVHVRPLVDVNGIPASDLNVQTDER